MTDTEEAQRGTDDAVIAQTWRWIQRFVVELNLCPFARREIDAGRVRLVVTCAASEDALLSALEREFDVLNADPSIATSFLIHPQVLEDFLAFNDFLGDVDRLLRQHQLEGVFQVASFHPHYQFAGTESRAAENYSNRSLYPMLHLLREDDVAAAVAHHPDVDSIPDRNIALLQDIGAESLYDRRRECLKL